MSKSHLDSEVDRLKEELKKMEAEGEEESQRAMDERTVKMRKETATKKAEFMKERREVQGKIILDILMAKMDQVQATPLTSPTLEAISETATWKKPAAEEETYIEKEEKQEVKPKARPNPK